MSNKKRYGWIAGSLATLVAGYLSYASLSSHYNPVFPPFYERWRKSLIV